MRWKRGRRTAKRPLPACERSARADSDAVLQRSVRDLCVAARLQASEPAHIAPDTEPQNEGSRRVALQRYLDELAYDSEAEEQQVDTDAEMYDSD